jgi:hypothetical protein
MLWRGYKYILTWLCGLLRTSFITNASSFIRHPSLLGFSTRIVSQVEVIKLTPNPNLADLGPYFVWLLHLNLYSASVYQKLSPSLAFLSRWPGQTNLPTMFKDNPMGGGCKYCHVFLFSLVRGNNNVDSSDLIMKFIWTILRRLHATVVTHNFAFDSTQTRVF